VPKNAEFSKAVLDVAREVDDEALPVEYKEGVTKYYQLLGKGGVNSGDAGVEKAVE